MDQMNERSAADELAAAPAQTKAVDFKVGAGKGVYKFSMAIRAACGRAR